jgi:hypothetical protein
MASWSVLNVRIRTVSPSSVKRTSPMRSAANSERLAISAKKNTGYQKRGRITPAGRKGIRSSAVR